MAAFKDLCQDCCIQCPDPKASHCWATPLLETPGPSQTRLAQSLVMSLLLFPEFWWTQGFVCALQESVYPVVWKFCNHIPLSFKVKFPGGSQSLCGIPRLGNLLWALELVQQWEIFLVQLLSSLWVVCSVTLCWGLHAIAPSLAAARSPAPGACHCWPCLCRRHSAAQRQVWLSLLWSPWFLVHTWFCLSPLSVSGGYRVLF